MSSTPSRCTDRERGPTPRRAASRGAPASRPLAGRPRHTPAPDPAQARLGRANRLRCTRLSSPDPSTTVSTLQAAPRASSIRAVAPAQRESSSAASCSDARMRSKVSALVMRPSPTAAGVSDPDGRVLGNPVRSYARRNALSYSHLGGMRRLKKFADRVQRAQFRTHPRRSATADRWQTAHPCRRVWPVTTSNDRGCAWRRCRVFAAATRRGRLPSAGDSRCVSAMRSTPPAHICRSSPRRPPCSRLHAPSDRHTPPSASNLRFPACRKNISDGTCGSMSPSLTTHQWAFPSSAANAASPARGAGALPERAQGHRRAALRDRPMPARRHGSWPRYGMALRMPRHKGVTAAGRTDSLVTELIAEPINVMADQLAAKLRQRLQSAEWETGILSALKPLFSGDCSTHRRSKRTGRRPRSRHFQPLRRSQRLDRTDPGQGPSWRRGSRRRESTRTGLPNAACEWPRQRHRGGSPRNRRGTFRRTATGNVPAEQRTPRTVHFLRR